MGLEAQVWEDPQPVDHDLADFAVSKQDQSKSQFSQEIREYKDEGIQCSLVGEPYKNLAETQLDQCRDSIAAIEKVLRDNEPGPI